MSKDCLSIVNRTPDSSCNYHQSICRNCQSGFYICIHKLLGRYVGYVTKEKG